jgi:hypothetical protein
MGCCNGKPALQVLTMENIEDDGRVEVGRTAAHGRKITRKVAKTPYAEIKQHMIEKATPIDTKGKPSPNGPKNGDVPDTGMMVDRMTLGFDLGYQPVGKNAWGWGSRKASMRKAVRQEPSNRGGIFVTKEPQPLLAGSWVTRPGYIIVINETTAAVRVQPTEEEREALASTIVVIERKGDKAPFGVVRPGGPHFGGEVPAPEECTIRCLSEYEAEVRVIVVPA